MLAGACTAGAREAGPFEGAWESIGYGFYLVVDGGVADVYEHTAVGCLAVSSGPARGISDVATLEGDGRLVLRDRGRTIEFSKLAAVPAECLTGLDPGAAFSVAAATVEEHHPSLGLRDPDWGERRDALAAGLVGGVDPALMLAAIQEMLAALADPQVRLAVYEPALLPGASWSAGPLPEGARRLRDRLDSSAGGLARAEDGAVVWSPLPDGPGYLAITRLGGFDDDPDEEERRLASALDRALAGIDGSGGLIVDLRVLRDGTQSAALLVASRFVDREVTVGSRSVRIGGTGDYTDPLPITVRPLATGAYGGRLVVLVGPGTAGPGELLALALLRAPDVVLVGEATAGSPSPLLVRSLPNGWTLGIPHQRVWDPTGRLIEMAGILPDEVVPEGEGGEDPQLARAVVVAGA